MSCDNRLKKECFTELETFINSLADKNGALISVLHKAQEIFGYLPEEVQTFVAEQLGISVAKVYGVVSFYSFFTMTPKGKFPIAVCMGTACYVRGAEKVLHDFEKQFENKEITRPLNWGGYIVKPISMEFWQGRPNRMHDRIRYNLQENFDWKIERLAP